MATPNWPLFTVAVLGVTIGLLALSRLSAAVIGAEQDRRSGDGPPTEPTAAVGAGGSPGPALPSGPALAANVAVTHGLVTVVLAGLVWYAAVPFDALGLAVPTGRAAAIGVGVGAGLYLASELSTMLADRLGLPSDEALRELLAPDGPAGWALLLGVSLPLIAIAEELLFRAILIGAVSAGFGVPVWALVLGSSVLFGLGHSAQGTLGVGVTAAIGVVLGATFVLTGSFATVVIAHYVVDGLEFGVREWVFG